MSGASASIATPEPAADPMDLYGFWRSQASFRVRVALNWKGIAYRDIPINLDAGAQQDEAFRKINPLGTLPALMVDNEPLTQSLAILEYIEETYREPALLPPDPRGRARVRSLAAIAVSDSHPLIVPRVRRQLATLIEVDAGLWKAWQTHWFTLGLRGFEARLAGVAATGTFCHGDEVSFADICLVGLQAGATTFGIEVADVPTVARIVAHCRALPAFEWAEARNQIDYPG